MKVLKCTLPFDVKIQQLVNNYKPTNTDKPSVEMMLLIENVMLIYSPPRRLSMYEKEIVKQQVEAWLKEGVMGRSRSPYGNPVVVVKNKDNRPRVGIDYRRLNATTVKDSFPIPLIYSILDNLQSERIYTVLH